MSMLAAVPKGDVIASGGVMVSVTDKHTKCKLFIIYTSKQT